MVTLQVIDALHLVGRQFEVEDVVVLGDVGGIGRAGDGDGAALQMPAEQHLIGRLAVSLGDAGDHLVFDGAKVQRKRQSVVTRIASKLSHFAEGFFSKDLCLSLSNDTGGS